MIRSAASQFRWANLFTYLGVSAAAIAIAFTDGPATRFWAGAGIAIACAFDLFDGRFARLFPRTEDDRRFGVEIDSLADVISFGVAPPVCMLRVAPATALTDRAMLLVAGIFYLVCIMTRLAHYNIFQAGTGGFVGLPSNLPGLIVAILLLGVPGPKLAAAVLVLTGAAAVGGFRIPRPSPIILYTLLAICVVVAGLHLFRLVAG